MIILGIDLGKARTGVAICDRGELLASPLTVVNEHNRERLVERLAALAQENRAELLAGQASVTDLSGQPVEGYRDGAFAQAAFSIFIFCS